MARPTVGLRVGRLRTPFFGEAVRLATIAPYKSANHPPLTPFLTNVGRYNRGAVSRSTLVDMGIRKPSPTYSNYFGVGRYAIVSKLRGNRKGDVSRL